MGDWEPLTNYIKMIPGSDEDAKALLPSRYDAMVWGGAGLFLAGVLVALTNVFLGITLLILGDGIAVGSLSLDIKKRRGSVVSMAGNVIAGIWIAIQIFLTIFFIYLF